MATDTRTESGFYCSTSGTYFVDKESLAEHYKSDFHRYNLKRKVAGLPPVTKEWFDSRKAQLSSVSTTTVQKIWFDPLTRKKFSTENTYQAHVRSKKYQDLVKKSGQAAPEPVIMLKKLDEDGGYRLAMHANAREPPVSAQLLAACAGLLNHLEHLTHCKHAASITLTLHASRCTPLGCCVLVCTLHTSPHILTLTCAAVPRRRAAAAAAGAGSLSSSSVLCSQAQGVYSEACIIQAGRHAHGRCFRCQPAAGAGGGGAVRGGLWLGDSV
jgi:hypothetical protein